MDPITVDHGGTGREEDGKGGGAPQRGAERTRGLQWTDHRQVQEDIYGCKFGKGKVWD